MKLYYFQGTPPNFGDELNATMWAHVMPPGFIDGDPDHLLVGIGSILQHDLPQARRRIVLGSGYGGYTRKPALDESWDVRFVRGPQTVRELDLDPSLAIADSAILLRETPLPAPAPGIDAAFMPHYESIARGNWKKVCARAGVHFIDPTRPTDEVIAQIRGARIVVAEAMHGAIVSDALRTPWVAVRPFHHVHRFKWRDWAEALEIDLKVQTLLPSNAREAWAYTTGRWGSGPRAIAYLDGAMARPANEALLWAAARSLRHLASGPGHLSEDRVIERATARALDAVHATVQAYAAPPDVRLGVG